MQELITIQQHSDGRRVVNARDLHSFLESRQDFSDWIKKRIAKYDFVENVDFLVFHKKMENPQGGRSAIEYALTLDMAKELSMVENNDKGRQARRYFIECERKAITPPPANIGNRLEMARMLSEAAAALEEAERENSFLVEQNTKYAEYHQLTKPVVEYYCKTLQSNELIPITIIAKELGLNSALSLNLALHKAGIQYKMNGTWLLYAKYADRGYTRTKTYTTVNGIGETVTHIQTYWTQKGRRFIHDLFANGPFL